MSGKPQGHDGAENKTVDASDLSRREFVQGAGASLVVAAAVPKAIEAAPQDRTTAERPPEAPRTRIRLTVNGTIHRIEVEDRWTLAELLRDHLELTGTKIGCGRSECGACTVIMDGKAVYSCSQLAVWVDGSTIETVEGLVQGGKPSPLQQAFMDHNGAQCGFCTPGQIMAATALLGSNPTPTPPEVRAGLVGNLCRCSNYNAIVEAVMAVSSSNGGAG